MYPVIKAYARAAVPYAATFPSGFAAGRHYRNWIRMGILGSNALTALSEKVAIAACRGTGQCNPSHSACKRD
jgi:hypothetical protein